MQKVGRSATVTDAGVGCAVSWLWIGSWWLCGAPMISNESINVARLIVLNGPDTAEHRPVLPRPAAGQQKNTTTCLQKLLINIHQ